MDTLTPNIKSIIMTVSCTQSVLYQHNGETPQLSCKTKLCYISWMEILKMPVDTQISSLPMTLQPILTTMEWTSSITGFMTTLTLIKSMLNILKKIKANLESLPVKLTLMTIKKCMKLLVLISQGLSNLNLKEFLIWDWKLSFTTGKTILSSILQEF